MLAKGQYFFLPLTGMTALTHHAHKCISTPHSQLQLLLGWGLQTAQSRPAYYKRETTVRSLGWSFQLVVRERGKAPALRPELLQAAEHFISLCSLGRIQLRV